MARLWWRLVRFGFRLLYNEFAFTYDIVSWIVSLGAWRCWTRTALKYLGTESPVLELAHGTGSLQLDLNAAGYKTAGYDLSPSMGRIARGKLRRRGLPVRLARGQAQRLPFASGVFAAVVSTFPTEFVTARETVDEVYRVLRPGGVFVIVPNAMLTSGGRIEQALEGLYRITGQRGGMAKPEALNALFAPFTLDVVQEHCPRSIVTVIVARKSE